MAPLTKDEQARVDRFDQLKEWRHTGEQPVTDDELVEARKCAYWAVRNAETLNKAHAERSGQKHERRQQR